MAYRSSSTQKLQNYFDSKLVRTRENPVDIGSQLLNTAAVILDDANLRYQREIRALKLSKCPSGLDNKGVYYSVNLDNNYSLNDQSKSLNSVSGLKGSLNYDLTVYDDTLPIPAGYLLDPLRSSVQISDPLLASFFGRDVPILTVSINQTLAITNKLSFWLSDTFQPSLLIDVVIYGVKYPVSPWINSNQVLDSESIQITKEGYFESFSSWISIQKIVVRNLPDNGQLKCYSMPFGLPANLDELRSASVPAFRDVTFDKYWQISPSENLLKESYYLDNLSGLVYYQSYNLSSGASCLAIEPNTWGGLLGSGTTLHYFDRREPLPDLIGTGLFVEPCYGLDVFYDVSNPGQIRNITIRPVPYKKSEIVVQYRLIIEAPDNTLFVLLPDGSYLNYSGSAGWQNGSPSTSNLLLDQTGLYRITLECLDQNGVVSFDVFPYNNFNDADIIKRFYDLSNIVVNIESIGYDFLGNLWIWDGLWAVPIKPYYNAYILDPIGRKIYLTEEWDQVNYL